MRFAALAEVQGNALALNAVLEAINANERRIDRIVCAGDSVGLGPQPNEVIDLFKKWEVDAVLGNYDDAVAFDRPSSGVDFATPEEELADMAAMQWTRQALTPANLTYLKQLPRDLRLSRSAGGIQVKRDSDDPTTSEFRRTFFTRAFLGGLFRPPPNVAKRIMVVHGSTRALNEYVRPDTAQSILEVIGRDAQTDMLISGHAGSGFERSHGGVTFVGSGSVSGPRAIPGRAEYVIIEVREGIVVEMEAVDYDARAYLQAVEASGLPDLLKDVYAARVP